jgi:hypothetical protein
MHYVGDYPDGDWSSWSGSLRFRVPHVPPGRYQLVVYCDPCHRGRGGTLVVNNWLWRRSERIRGTALRILPATDGSSSRLSAHESALALAVVTAAGSTFLIVRARGSAR